MQEPTGTGTMHMVHMDCPAITDLRDKVTAICGTETVWIHGNPLKCPICVELMLKPMHCPMCGTTMHVAIDR